MFGTGLGVYLPIVVYLIAIGSCLTSLVRPLVGIFTLALIMPLQSGRLRLVEYPMGSQLPLLLLVSVAIGVLLSGGSLTMPKLARRSIIGLCVVTYLSLWIGPVVLPTVPWPIFTSIGGQETPFGFWVSFMHLPALFVLAYSTVKTKRQMQVLLLMMMVGYLWNMKNFYSSTQGRSADHFSSGLRSGVGPDFGGSNGRAAFGTQCTLFLIAFFGRIRRLPIRIATALLILAGGYSIVFSYSRGAWLAFACGAVYLSLYHVRWLLIIGLLAGMFAGSLLPSAVVERATMTYDTGTLDQSSQGRIDIWQHAFVTGAIDPIFGIGFNSYRYHRAGQELRDTHNIYIKAFVETGLVGLGCLLSLMFLALKAGHALSRSSEDQFFRALGAGYAAYMLAVVIANCFGDRWTYVDLSSYTWILLALVAKASLWVQEARAEKRGAAAPLHPATVAA